MIRALYTAASGMSAQQMNLDTIANNLANSGTTGFRQMRLQFQDMVTQLLGHLTRRVEALAMMNEALTQVADRCVGSGLVEQVPQLREQLARCARAVDDARHHTYHNPVTQTGMSTGGVELF